MGNNAFLLIGSAESGKSTFLAVNYYLMQAMSSQKKFFLESGNDRTAEILFDWETALNHGNFPERTKITNTDLKLNLWLSPKKKIKIDNIDVSGELYNRFNPLIKKTELSEEEEEINDIIKNSLLHVIIIDSTTVKNIEDLRYHDFFYNNILTNIKKICQYEHGKHTPVIIVFTKLDKISKELTPTEFAERYFPKTYKQYKYFFNKNNSLIFGCSIGDVENEKIKNFNPKGYTEIMDVIIKIILKRLT